MWKLIKMLFSAFLCVLIPILSAFAVVKTFTFFERANVELGFQHYAEKADPKTFLKMPANACVNLGYGLVGLYWLWKVNRRKKKLRDKAFFYYVFAWMCMFYGLVQFGRIVTQTRLFAILDQWLTLPFFAWIVCWNEFMYRGYWQTSRYLFTLRVSVLSYFAVLCHDFAFDVLLGLHILAAVVYSIRTQHKPDLGTRKSLIFFYLALSSCAGFVFLKLADHYLAQYSIFQRFTGHFWSKLCDVAQIHFAANFFTNLAGQHNKGTK